MLLATVSMASAFTMSTRTFEGGCGFNRMPKNVAMISGPMKTHKMASRLLGVSRALFSAM
jgi:hypothetical protein